ncbi:hypothetical protein J6590_028762 [Homalodisca vitripennis]|nr:hypothetical protein J6590_028762 [Homalodisca vitripennis]
MEKTLEALDPNKGPGPDSIPPEEGTPALSGVPQGSLLGPVLFSIFIDGFGLNLPTDFLLFADDAKIYTEVTVPWDCIKLQSSSTF